MEKQHLLKRLFFKSLLLLFLIYTALFNKTLFVNGVKADVVTHGCGATYSRSPENICECQGVPSEGVLLTTKAGMPDRMCCGWVDGEFCLNDPTSEPEEGGQEIGPNVSPLTAEDLEAFNPIAQLSNKASTFLPGGDFSIAAVINEALNLIFPLAGLILFVMIVWGGFEMLTGAASKKSLDAGKQRIQAAVIGFLLLFASYWIIQIVETVTGVKILG